MRLPGSDTIHAAGTTSRLDVAIGGSGIALMSRLIARDATALIIGSGSIVLTRDPQPRRKHIGQRHDLYTGNPTQVSKSVTSRGAISGD